MKNIILVVCLVACAVSAVAPLSATVITFNVVLDGLQEVPANASPGTAPATVVVDNLLNTVAVSLTFSNLLSPTNNAHIHCCAAPGVNAPVVIPFTGFPLGVMSGSYSNTFSGIDPTIIAGLFAGAGYINIHTVQLPGGEIRANLTPEPSSVMLLGLGLAGLVTRRVLKKRASHC